MDLNILPLAITMMVGPQIMSAIIFVTHPAPLKISAMFLTGVAVGTAVGVAVALGVAHVVGNQESLGSPSDKTSLGSIVQYGLVALLVAAALKNYLGRETSEPPKWLGQLMAADAGKALLIGLLVIILMPSDILIMLTVAMNLEHHQLGWVSSLPFILATLLIAALPVLVYLLFRRQAKTLMPRVRDWMNEKSWLVNIIASGIFILLILA